MCTRSSIACCTTRSATSRPSCTRAAAATIRSRPPRASGRWTRACALDARRARSAARDARPGATALRDACSCRRTRTCSARIPVSGRALDALALLAARARPRAPRAAARVRRRAPARLRRGRRLRVSRSRACSCRAASASTRSRRTRIDAVSDRDFVAELLFTSTMIGDPSVAARRGSDHLRLERVRLRAVRRLRSRTGSSMMPQKRNPDALELARGSGGAHARRPHDAARDAQGTAERATTRICRTTSARCSTRSTRCCSCCPAVAGALARDARSSRERMRAALVEHDDGDRSRRLSRAKGTTFREAHGAVGALVRQSEESGVELHALPSQGVQGGAPAASAPMCSTRSRRWRASSVARRKAARARRRCARRSRARVRR